MLKEEIIDFFKDLMPFSLLSENELHEIIEDISMEYYPGGVMILTQGGPPSGHLAVIKKGGVKISMTTDKGDEKVIDFRSEGEQFGLLSLISGDHSRTNVNAVEDTICYLLSKEKVLTLLKENPSVNEYFLKSFFVSLIDKTYEETRRRHNGAPESERLLFTTPAGDIVRGASITAAPSDSIREAAGIMAANKVSSLVVVDTSGSPVGMVTDRDLREKVVAQGRDVNSPLHTIMSSTLISVDAADTCFEALIRMIRHKIHHIIVMDGKVLKGMITNHDFMLLQGASPTALVKEISQIQSTADFKDTVANFIRSVGTLLRYGARAHNITGLITELMEKITNGVIDLQEKQTGPAPVPYGLFFFGDGGRRELTLDFQIKMGIVYHKPENPKEAVEVSAYFKDFVKRINSALADSNLPCNTGNCIIEDRVHSFSDWEGLLTKWGTGAGTALDNDLFDMRPIRGDKDMVFALQRFLLRRAGSYRGIREAVAATTLQNRPPLGFFKNFVVEKGGEHKDELDLYLKGIEPLVDCVRIFAIEKEIDNLSTIGRLKEIQKRKALRHADEIERALDYLYGLLIHNQLLQAEKGLPPDSFVNPDGLSSFARKTLKESFQLIESLYGEIENNYWGGKILP